MSLVSVIIPCYQQGEFLSEAISSIVRQSHSNWECIVINDGSSDDTEAIALSWVEKDHRIKYTGKPNGGLSSARNMGLKKAKGDFLQFLDADDWILPNKFETQLAALKTRKENTVAICDHFTFDDRTQEFVERTYTSPFIDPLKFKEEIITEWEFRKSIPCHNLLIPKKLVDAHALGFDESLPNHEDWVFWCRLFYYAPAVCFQAEKFARYRIRPVKMTSNRELMVKGFLEATFILEKFYRQAHEPKLQSCVRKIRKEIKNNLFEHSVFHNLLAENYQRVKQLLNTEKDRP